MLSRICCVFLLVCVALSVFADGYKRQPGIDIINYKFDLTLADETDKITGTATIDIKLLQGGVKQLVLDLKSPEGAKGMTVQEVRSTAGDVKFNHEDDKLTIEFSKPPMVSETTQIIIIYSGVPTGGLWIGDNKYGDRGFFSLNWPNRAREWLPMIDHPYDKATHEFIVTAPSHYQVVSNGLLQETKDHPNNTRTSHWKQSIPVSSWLTALAVSRYSVRYFDNYEGIQLSSWVFPQDRDKGIITFETPAKRSLKFFSEFIAPIEYEKLAHIQAPGFGGGTELASAIFYGQDAVTERAATGLVVHETAHQWWGDSVTEEDWNDVWLSEGFATYFTLLYTEHYEGRDAFVEGLKNARNRVYSMESDNPNRPIVHKDLQDMKLVLSGIQYQKGAWVLHMLRQRIGTQNFWKGIREYYAKHRNGQATTDDFRRMMESVSGEDLELFFTQWLTRGVSPEVKITWSFEEDILTINIEQIQKGEIYELPLLIQIEDKNGRSVNIPFTSYEATMRMRLRLDGPPNAITFDPETQSLIKWSIEKSGSIS